MNKSLTLMFLFGILLFSVKSGCDDEVDLDDEDDDDNDD
jgi:hypothetical protein